MPYEPKLGEMERIKYKTPIRQMQSTSTTPIRQLKSINADTTKIAQVVDDFESMIGFPNRSLNTTKLGSNFDRSKLESNLDMASSIRGIEVKKMSQEELNKIHL